MPNISHNYRTEWSNYHRTHEGEVREIAHVYAADIADMAGPDRFAATAKTFYKFIDQTLAGRGGLFQQTPAEAAVMVGTGWSFSNLSVARDLLLDLSGLSGMAMAQPIHMHENTTLDLGYVALASGGTRLRELVEWAQTKGRSIRTSGSFLGTTIAGSFATASHGSRLGFGGIQDMVVGMHIITGKENSVWLERASRPVLNDATALSFATKVIRDDNMFEDALIHLGGMGIVNGVAIELIDNKGYHRLAVNQAIDSAWLRKIENGEFRQLATELGHDADPVFYELTIDPQGYNGPIALHTMLFEGGKARGEEQKKSITVIADLIAAYATYPDTILNKFNPVAFSLSKTAGTIGSDSAISKPLSPPPVIQIYASPNIFTYSPAPINTDEPGYSWLAYHAGDVTGGVPGALYNASYAIDRCNLEQAIRAMCEIVKKNQLPETFLFTIRFVSNASGTMRFTRFQECAVIEIDGISKNAPRLPDWPDPDVLGQVIVNGAALVREALEAAGVDYSMHWGKLGGLDRSKVHNDYGPAHDPQSPIGRWRATRDALLSEETKGLFWSEALRELGLLERPPVTE